LSRQGRDANELGPMATPKPNLLMWNISQM